MTSVVLPRPLRFHGQDNPNYLAPNFSEISLADDQEIVDALDYVLQARSKMVSATQKLELLSSIKSWSRGHNVGACRNATNNDWSRLKLPLMARVYLKQLVTQAPSLTPIEMLECDFNNGIPINMEDYEERIREISNMGFTRAQALEGLLVTKENRQDVRENDVEKDSGHAVNYLLMDTRPKKLERERAKRRNGNSVSPAHHHSQLKAQEAARETKLANAKKSTQELKNDVEKIVKQLKEAQNTRKKLESQLDEQKRQSEKLLFTQFVQGMLVDGTVNAVERTRLAGYQERVGLGEDMFNEVLKDLGISNEKFDTMKDFEEMQSAEDQECLICFEVPRNQLLMPSMQIALCPTCATQWRGDNFNNVTCPKTGQSIDQIVEVKLQW